MKTSIKKRLKIFKALGKSTSIFTPIATQIENNRYYQQESENQPNLMLIKSFMQPKLQQRKVSLEPKCKTRCRSAMNQAIGIKKRKERRTSPLKQRQKQREKSQVTPKEDLQFEQLIKCKQVLKKTNRIHQDRWRLLSSIQTKLVQEIQSNIFRRRLGQGKRGSQEIQQKQQQIKAKSEVKFTDLMQIKQVQMQKDEQKKQKKVRQFVLNKIAKKPNLLSRTQPSFESYGGIFKGSSFRDPWKIFSHSFGRLSTKQQELTGWDTSVEI